ncbi:MAG: peptidoglycan-N-acetylglucosamine deacetylase [Actinomycetota bacterium]
MRVAVGVAVPAFLIAQPTGASSRQTRVLATHMLAPTSSSTTSTTAEPTTAAPTTTATTTPPDTSTSRPPSTTVHHRASTPTTWGANAAPVALTFDDGPNETYTPQVLDILAQYGVHATFFMVGSEVAALPALAHRVVDEGNAVGDHTWDHVDLTTLDDQGFRDQIDRTQEQLGTLVGGSVNCVRPPFGRTNQYVRDQLRARGLTIAKWTKDTEDWKEPPTNTIVQRALAGAAPGAVILFHDSGPDMSHTVAALPAIIEGIEARGLRIAPICAPGVRAAPVPDGTIGPE